MIITTTPTVEGREITAGHGVVAGGTESGADIFRDLIAKFSDVVRDLSGAHEASRPNARNSAPRGPERGGRDAVGNSVAGIDLDCVVVNDMLKDSVTGTAVTVA